VAGEVALHNGIMRVCTLREDISPFKLMVPIEAVVRQLPFKAIGQ